MSTVTKETQIPMQPVLSNDTTSATHLLSNNKMTMTALPTKYKILILLLTLISIGGIIGCIILTLKINSSSSTDSKFDTATPKNLIIMIGDGMGTSYNSAYRIYKNRTFNFIDQYFKGRYSTSPSNSYPFGIIDSAAGAVAFASGIQTLNEAVGVDASFNPIGSILAAAKRKGKGTGIVCTKSVTDATPASFTAHSLWRYWEHLIADQQATRQYNEAPIIDLMFGGGKRYFDTLYDDTPFWNDTSVYKDTYKWNTLVDKYDEFVELISDDLPAMALFTNGNFPYYLDRLNDENMHQIPDLLEMSMKAIELLDNKYNKDGYFLLIEGSRIDSCGHDNDIVCMLWEMEEFENTIESVIKYAEKDGNTLVVILADHETGGLSIGRDASLIKNNIVNYKAGSMPRNWQNGGISEYWGSYIYSMEIAPMNDIKDIITNEGLYKFYPYDVQFAKHTAQWLEDSIDVMINSENGTTVNDVYKLIEENYLGNVYRLSEQEKMYVNNTWLKEVRDGWNPEMKYAILMNTRTLTGWSTHEHTGADISLYAFGSSQNKFYGHFTNYQVGQLLSEIFDVVKEQNEETEWLRQQFVNGIYPKLCDEKMKPSPAILEWNMSVEYPNGNLLYGEYCVEEWIS
eukprot:402204_1